MAIQFGVSLVLTAALLMPVLNRHKSSRTFCAPVRALAEAGTQYQLFSVGFSREEYIFYAKHFHRPILLGSPDEKLLSVNELERLSRVYEVGRRNFLEAVSTVIIEDWSSLHPEEFANLRAAVSDAGNKEENSLQCRKLRYGDRHGRGHHSGCAGKLEDRSGCSCRARIRP